MSEQLKPGMTAHCSCEYELHNADGTATGMKVSMQKGETLPPTDQDGQYYCPCNGGCRC